MYVRAIAAYAFLYVIKYAVLSRVLAGLFFVSVADRELALTAVSALFYTVGGFVLVSAVTRRIRTSALVIAVTSATLYFGDRLEGFVRAAIYRLAFHGSQVGPNYETVLWVNFAAMSALTLVVAVRQIQRLHIDSGP